MTTGGVNSLALTVRSLAGSETRPVKRGVAKRGDRSGNPPHARDCAVFFEDVDRVRFVRTPSFPT